jgi:hypothetical protein
VIGDEDELARPVRLVDRARGVRDDERADAEAAEHTHAEHRPVGRDALVQMRPPPHHRNGHVVDRAEHEHSRVADCRRYRPARNDGVGNLEAVLDLVGEPAEPASEDQPHARLETGALSNCANGIVERARARSHAEPSASRSS